MSKEVSRKKVRLHPVYRHAMFAGALALALWLYMSEGVIISVASFLLHTLMLGKILKAYIMLSLLHMLKVLFLISGISLIGYSFFIVLVRNCAGLIGHVSEKLENIFERPARIFDRHYAVSVTLLLAVITLAIYGPSLFFNFLSDDFGTISTVRSHGMKIFLKIFLPHTEAARFHYSPVGYVICGLPLVMSGYNPFWTHLLCVLLHLANSILVFYVCYRVTGRKVTSLVASILFCTFYLNYEVVIWACVGTFYSSATVFLLASFLYFMRYLNGGSKYHYGAFVALYALAQFTRESAWPFLLIYLLYEVLYAPLRRHGPGMAAWTRALAFSSIKYFVPAAISLVTIGLKYYSNIPLTTADLGRSSLGSIGAKLTEALLYVVIPNNLLNLTHIDLYRGELLNAGVALVLLSIVIAVKASKEMKLFYFWGFFTLSTTVLFTTGITSRFAYLPVAGFSIFFALLLVGVLERFASLVDSDVFSRRDAGPSDRRRVSGAVTILVGTVILLLIVAKGVSFINDYRDRWQRASNIVTNVLRDIKIYYPEPPTDSVAYFVDIPATLGNTPFGPTQVFANELSSSLALTYGTPFAKVIRPCQTGTSPYPVVPSKPVSFDELDRLSSQPGVEVIVFSSEIGSVRKWSPDKLAKDTGRSDRDP